MNLQAQYTMVCMKVLDARYCYYVLAHPIMSDAEYDRLENGLREFEKQNPTMRHPNSPTGYPGSDDATSYPRSVRNYRDQWYADENGEMASFSPRLSKPQGRSLQALNTINQEVLGVPLCIEQVQMLLDRGEIDAQGNPAY